jgi:hypothetical protein
MVVRYRGGHAWINILFRVAVLGIAATTYLVGAVALTFGTLLSALYLTFQWLRGGVWHFHTLADVFARGMAPDRPTQPEAWFLEAPLLISMPTIGGTLTIASIALFVAAELPRMAARS